jgi:hypothetical protein
MHRPITVLITWSSSAVADLAGSHSGARHRPTLLQLPEWNGDTNLEADDSSSGNSGGAAARASSESTSGSDDGSRQPSPQLSLPLAAAGSAREPQPQVCVVKLRIHA